jgi:citrate lyase subunit beta/citryl-CoA lyase/(S)-citramalyl-CoA lyase
MNNLFKYHSFLVTPSLKLKDISIMKKIEKSGADTSILDWEDAIPLSLKDEARQLTEKFLNTERDISVAIRINTVRQIEGLEDLEVFKRIKYEPEMIIVPSVESANEVGIVKKFFQENEIKTKIFSVIETTQGVLSADEIASVSDGLIFGSADYAASIGIELGWNELLYARYMIVTTAANHNIPAIDTPCFLLNDLDALNKECKAVKKLGFTGKIAIHPKQLSTINEIFEPTKQQLEWAREVVKSFHESEGKITKVNGEMIGPPFVERAKKILAQGQC